MHTRANIHSIQKLLTQAIKVTHLDIYYGIWLLLQMSFGKAAVAIHDCFGPNNAAWLIKPYPVTNQPSQRALDVQCTYIVRTMYQLYVQCTYIVRTVPAGLYQIGYD